MIRKVTRNTNTVRNVVQLFGVLIVLVAIVGLAQTRAAGQSGQSSIFSGSPNASPNLEAGRLPQVAPFSFRR